MNRGEQIAREIIGMDKKHTWKFLSPVAASPQAPRKKESPHKTSFFIKTLSPVAFYPSQGIPPKLENLSPQNISKNLAPKKHTLLRISFPTAH